MPHRIGWLGAITVVLALGACIRNPRQPLGVAGTPRDRSSNVITAAEIEQCNAMTAYEAVARLRPVWLRQTRTLSPNDRRDVYVDGMDWGGLEQLHGVPANHIEEIRFLSAIEATGRFGRVATQGLILIRTKVGPPR